MSHPSTRSVAAWTLLLPLFAACQPAPAPTPTPTVVGTGPTAAATPSMSTSASASSPSPTLSATLSPEAETLVRSLLSEQDTLFRTGQPGTQLTSLVTGDAVAETKSLIDSVQKSQRRYVGGKIDVVWLKAVTDGAQPGDLFVVLTCLDSRAVTIYENGAKVGMGGVAKERYHLRRPGQTLLVADVEHAAVKSC